MVDWHFAHAGSWPELVAAHDAWAEDYNAQVHWAHRGREYGRRSPQEVLGWLTGVRYRPEDLERAFFAVRSSRVLDSLGYARFRNWRIYAEEGLAHKEAAVWLQPGSLEYAGEALSRYDVELVPRTGELRAVGRPRLFESSYFLPQLRLFALEEAGWLKATKLDAYAPRWVRQPRALQEGAVPVPAGHLAPVDPSQRRWIPAAHRPASRRHKGEYRRRSQRANASEWRCWGMRPTAPATPRAASTATTPAAP